ncbi:MAG: mechanosensitive ion channel family protein [Candidatus Hydrothermae bacterium]|nr:mechanosensitive ion channel family protein [Candidatus Hydrothermae bacterium]
MKPFIQYIVFGGIVLFTTIISLVIKKILLVRLEHLAKKTTVSADDIIIRALKGVVLLWGVLIGILIALQVVTIPENIRNTLWSMTTVAILFSVTIFFANVLGEFVVSYTAKYSETLPSTSIFRNITRLVILIIGFLIILQRIGISISPLLTALGVGGLAVALALQDTLSNLFAGIHILVSKQVRPGDFIKLETGEEGYVVDISWRNTTIRMLPNNLVVIPNSKLASSIVTNYYMPEKMLSVLVSVGVSYDSDLEKVEKIVIEVAKEVMQTVPGGVPEFEPFVRYSSFGDFSINFSVIMRAKEYTDQFLIRHEFIKRLHKRFKKEGIEIPFPITTVYLKKE